MKMASGMNGVGLGGVVCRKGGSGWNKASGRTGSGDITKNGVRHIDVRTGLI